MTLREIAKQLDRIVSALPRVSSTAPKQPHPPYSVRAPEGELTADHIERWGELVARQIASRGELRALEPARAWPGAHDAAAGVVRVYRITTGELVAEVRAEYSRTDHNR